VYLDNLAFLKLYKVFVRVHFEFSASVWFPWTWELVDECEAVQRRSTRMLVGMDGLSYVKTQSFEVAIIDFSKY